jgi:small-conductance mechanosensitive channel
MDLELTRWPILNRAIWTLATMGVALAIGFIVNRLVINRLQRIAQRSTAKWDDAVVMELRRRIPLWAVLGGVWFSIGYWQLPEHPARLLSGLTFGLLGLSITNAVATIAVRSMAGLAPKLNPEIHVSGLMLNVIRLTIFTVGTLVVIRGLGVEITPILAALGVGGLAVALALQAPLSNLFAGLFLGLAGQIRIGDYIKMEPGMEGRVADSNWSATQLMTLAGNVVIVPNAQLASAIVTNFDRPSKDMGVGVELTVAADSDLAVIERIGLQVGRDVMRQVPGGVPDVEPAVRFLALTDLGVRFAVFVRAREFAEQVPVRHELIRRLLSALKDAGITIATVDRPSRTPGPR